MATITRADAEAKSKEAASFYRSKRYSEAFADYLGLAQAGYIASQRFVGWLYFRGAGVEKDYDQALVWLERAAHQEDAEAMFGVARVCMVKSDYKRAYKWYQKSADRNFLPSMYWVARFHRDGVLGEKDEFVAFRMFQEAARLGHLKSQREYFVMLMKGYAGFYGRFKGVFLLGKLIFLATCQGIRDPFDPKAMV